MGYVNKQAIQLFELDERKTRGELLYETTGVCHTCHSEIPAKVVSVKNQVYLTYACCGKKNSILREKDAGMYMRVHSLTPKGVSRPIMSLEALKNAPLQQVYIFVTPKCDAACPLCIMDWQMGREKRDVVRAEYSIPELRHVLEVGGIRGRDVMFSGGEPAVRDDLPEMIRIAKNAGNVTTIFTNGKRISKDLDYAKALKRAGLDVVQLSFDSLDDSLYKVTKGEPLLKTKLGALRNLKEAGIPVILAPTIAVGYNEKELGKLLGFCAKNNETIKQLLIRPLAPIGKVNISLKNTITPHEILVGLEKQTAGAVSVKNTLAFMQVRMSAFKLIGKLFGEKTAYKFAWGRGFSTLLFVDSRGNVGPYFSTAELEGTKKVIDSALGKRTKAGALAALAVGLPKLLTKKKAALARKFLLDGFNRTRIVNNSWNLKGLLQLHVADPFYKTTVDCSVHSNGCDLVRFRGEDIKKIQVQNWY